LMGFGVTKFRQFELKRQIGLLRSQKIQLTSHS
jgi:hypothetical protein